MKYFGGAFGFDSEGNIDEYLREMGFYLITEVVNKDYVQEAYGKKYA